MGRVFPSLDEEGLEWIAEELLADFEHARGVITGPPIPIDDICEKHLKFGLEFDDLHERLGVPRASAKKPDILGKIFGRRRRIVIEESLDPEVNPSMEARLRFMLAHMVGHAHLHLHLFDPKWPPTMFRDNGKALFTCRSDHAKKSEEWQADYLAWCLLMSSRMVLAAWDELSPDRKPRVRRRQTPAAHLVLETECTRTSLGDFDFGEGEERLYRLLAERFVVSPIAMRMRLEDLGLLLRAVPHQGLLLGE